MILKKSVLTFAIQVATVALTLGVAIVVTRETGASGKGIFTLLGLVAQLVTLVCSVGIAWASIYYIGRNVYPLEDVVSTVLTTGLIASVVATIVVAAGYLVFQHTYFRDVSSAQLAIGLAAVPPLQITVACSSMVLGMNRPLEWAAVPAVQILVTLIGQLLLAVLGRLTTSSALAAWLLGVIAAMVFALWLVRSRSRIRLRIDRGVLGALFRFGIKGYTANTIMLLNYRLDSLILNGIAGAASVGFYSISVAMAEAQWYIANAIGSVMFPHVAASDRADSDRITPIVCRNTIFVTFLAAVAMFALSRLLIVTLFGPAMLPALYPLWLLLPGVVTASAAKVIASYLSGIGKPTYAMYISASHLVLTIALDVTLIPRLGIAGAAIASSIVYTSATVFSVWAFVHESRNSVWATLVVGPDDFDRYRRLLGTTYRRLTSLRAAASVR